MLDQAVNEDVHTPIDSSFSNMKMMAVILVRMIINIQNHRVSPSLLRPR